MSEVIVIPPRPLIASCPECDTVRELPEDWQSVLRGSLPEEDAKEWDGELRCLNWQHPEPIVMTVSPNPRYPGEEA